MKESDLHKKRIEYNRLMIERDKKLAYQKELLLAAKNKDANKIIELLDFVEIDYIAPTDEELCSIAFRPVVYHECEQDSKQIMFYVGNYRRENETVFKFLGTNFDSATHKEYMDLETGKVYTIPIDQSVAFEKNHVVIGMGLENYDYEDYSRAYDQFQLWYFLQLTSHSQAQMLEKLKQMDEEKIKQITKKRFR